MLYAYALAVPVVMAPGGGAPSVGAADVLLPLAAVGLLLPGRKVKAGAASFLAFSLAAILSVCVALIGKSGYGIADAAAFARVFACYVPFFLALRVERYSTRRVAGIASAFAVSSVVAMSIAMGLFLAGVQVRESQQQLWYEGSAGSQLRAGGLLGNSSDLGHLAAIAATVAIGFSILARGSYLRSWVVLLLSFCVMYASSSRAGFVHLAAFLAVVSPLMLNAVRLRLILLFTAMAAVAAWMVLPAESLSAAAMTSLNRLDFLNMLGNTTFFEGATRFSTWTNMLDLLAASPVFGIGYNMSIRLTGQAGDNSFLSILVETGLLAGTFYALFWVRLLGRAFSCPEVRHRLIGIGLIVGEVIHMATLDAHRMWSSMPVMMVFLGIWLRSSEEGMNDTAGRLRAAPGSKPYRHYASRVRAPASNGPATERTR